MKPLDIPFVSQLPSHCGPASLEMVYKYFGLSNLLQKELFAELPKQKDSRGNTFILLKDLMIDARGRGFQSFLLDLNNISKEEKVAVVSALIKLGIPLITLGQWKNDRTIGHFRVILGITEKHVHFHDPDDTNCEGNTKYTIDSFLKIWKPKGPLFGYLGVVVLRKEEKLPTVVLPHLIKE